MSFHISQNFVTFVGFPEGLSNCYSHLVRIWYITVLFRQPSSKVFLLILFIKRIVSGSAVPHAVILRKSAELSADDV